jgi:hypothetical protein
MIEKCYDYVILPSFVVLLLMIVLLGSFYIWLGVSTTESIAIVEEKINTIAEKTYECPLGQCPIDLKTGEKIFDPANPLQVYNFNPETQRCANFESCNIPPFLLAVNADGSTNNLGICENNLITGEPTYCRCSRSPQCPYYNASYFQTTKGNPYQSITNSRTTFSEIGRQPTDYYGITYKNLNDSFCQIPINWLFRVESSSCSSFSYESDPLQSIKGCIQSLPCNNGNIAFISSDPDNFSQNDLFKYPVACVQSQCLTPGLNHCNISGTCDIPATDEFYVPIFDTTSQILLCKSI